MQQTRQDSAQSSPSIQEIMDLALSLNKAENTDEILLELINTVLDVCRAERGSVFAISHQTNELFSKVKVGEKIQEIRVPISRRSIAGYTAETGQIVNLSDAYSEEEVARYPGLKFDDSWDKRTGFRSRSILSAPLQYKDTGLMGVIQIINSDQSKVFTKKDEGVLKSVASALAVAFFNQRRVKKKKNKFDLLLRENVISSGDLKKVLEQVEKEPNHPILGDAVSVLVNEFNVAKSLMGASLAEFYQTEFVEFSSSITIPPEFMKRLNEKYLRKQFWVPLAKEGDTITILTDDPSNLTKNRDIMSAVPSGKHVFHVGLREDILKFIDQATGKARSGIQVSSKISSIFDSVEDVEDHVQTAEAEEEEDLIRENAPVVVKTINKIVQEAFEKKVSDIHIEPQPDRKPAIIRFRRDGVCAPFTEIPNNFVRSLVNRIKIMSKLKLDERRIPQSGKIKLKHGDQDVELRVEVTPTVGGHEDVVLRVLASGKPLPLDKLNFSQANEKKTVELISQPYGIFLVVGPTGSGKTTTLHSVLGYLNQPDKKIWTAEDPVEITQAGIRQVQVNPNIKPIPFNFATAMRSFLRADPDIIMVGEMRDRETAGIAIEASLTGHLVLSTLHTNSAPETITRLLEMDMNPINLADAVLGILAQRLVRTLCPKCKEEKKADDEDLERIRTMYGEEFIHELGLDGQQEITLFQPKGCYACNLTGYSGRTGIHELLVGSSDVKRMIRTGASANEIKEQGLKEGMRTLRMDGIKKVLRGQTDLAQVVRVCIE